MGYEERKSIQVLAWRYTRSEQVHLRYMTVLCLILMTILPSTLALHPISPRSNAQVSPLIGRTAENASLLECLQVAPPVLSTPGGCEQYLMVHTFGSSYGQPFVGKSQISQVKVPCTR
jgi:hypothetical protein